jgi:hypothetical protein
MTEVISNGDAGLESVVISAAASTSPIMRTAAFQQARLMERNQRIGSAVLDALEKEDSKDCKIEGLIALGDHGTLDARTHALLSQLMVNHEHAGAISVAAINAYVALKGDLAHAISAISMLLYSDCEAHYQRGAKNAVLNTLAGLKERANIAAPILAQFILNENEAESNRSMACYVLRDIYATPSQVSVALAKCLLTTDAGLLSSALDMLEVIGVTKEALPYLLSAMEYEDPRTGQVRNRHPGIFGMASSDMHQFVADMIGTLGKDGEKAIPALEELLTRSTDTPPRQTRVSPPEYRGRGRPPNHSNEVAAPVRYTSEKAKEAARKALVAIRG